MCFASPVIEVELGPDLGSAAHASQFVHAVACAQHGSDTTRRAALLASELATLAILQGMPPAILSVACTSRGELQVSVSDALPTMPPDDPTLHPYGLEVSLQLICVISDAWGVVSYPGGKTIWSSVRAVPPPSR